MDLAGRLEPLTIRDARRLERRLRRAGPEAIDAIEAELAAAERRVAARRAAVPALRYPAGLPIVECREELLAAIEANQVVIVAGETGSGKTTQLPKLCLELGRGVRGSIAHTQPRRIAARTVAERIAEELDTPLGGVVGYTVRFTDRASDRTLVRLMTDGILLAQLHRDRDLSRYDTVIVDEAHERSLNIDFLLGYLSQLRHRRPDLKVVVTSATIDTARFAAHFGGAPVVEVSGRTYPVEVRYQPPTEDADQVQAISDALDTLPWDGDVLVFLSGEREIRDTADALARQARPHTEILPLYARLSAAEQHRVFAPHTGRRIVLATNVAETSLTVPGIRFVIDPGRARISRFNRRTKVQRLPIEPISRASADQRAGRCGRVGPGICLRLYSEEDFAERPEFTEPEILRTNLASVLLQMAALDLGDVAAFPFVDPPDLRSIRDGIALLEELGALRPDGGLTAVGRQLTGLPIDPRLGRMLVEAARTGCLSELLVITAGLSIQDPRERPVDARDAAAAAHARFRDKESDFLSILHLWTYVRAKQKELSSNQFRKLCRAEYLHHLRIREWQDLHTQLRQATDELGWSRNSEPAPPDRIHAAALAGLLSHIGVRDPEKQEYRGARSSTFQLAPGSTLARKPPRWVMVAELVETNRLWGRVAARIDPATAERLGSHLVRRSYGDPRWDAVQGRAVTEERVTLYGITLVSGRRVDFARVDAAEARELFLAHALVGGEWAARPAFQDRNRARIEDVRRLEHRARRPLLAGEERLYDFFDARVPGDVTSAKAFERWWATAGREQPDLLDAPTESLLDPGAPPVRDEDFPDTFCGRPVTYVFDPGAADDGVNLDVALTELHDLDGAAFDWNVPGRREELVTALIRTLPKPLRRRLVPVAEVARRFLSEARPEAAPLVEELAGFLSRQGGEPILPGSFDLAALPAHLRVTFRVIGTAGEVLAVGKELPALRRQLEPHLRAVIAAAAPELQRSGLREWPGGDLPRTTTGPARGYPALVDEGATVGVRVLPSVAEQHRAMWAGTRRLLVLTCAPSRREVERRLPNRVRLALRRFPEAMDDCATATAGRLLDLAGGPVWDASAWDELRAAVAASFLDTEVAAATFAGRIIELAGQIEARLDTLTQPALAAAVEDMTLQVAGLVHRRFVLASGAERLPDVLRYLRAVERRIDKLPSDPARDRERMARIQRLAAEVPPGADDVRWMIEELRVSTFAQVLGTPQPISEQRVRRAIERLAG